MSGPRRLTAQHAADKTTAASPVSDPGPRRGRRRRLSHSDKQAAVAQLRRLAHDGRPLPGHIQAIADKYGVSTRAVYRWFKEVDPAGDKPQRNRYVPSTEHLTVVAQEQNLFSAHELLSEAGQVTVSYETFARAIRERVDPTLLAAARDGYKGLVNNRAYLSWCPPHVNHTWNLDHTLLDMWVWPDHRARMPIRPWVTVVIDGYSSLIRAYPWKTDVTGDMVSAALVETGIERDYFGVTIGGQPEQVVFDNAAAHFGPSMREGVLSLGWIIAPTAAYSSWQNGTAERALGLINQRLANRAPGATKAGTTRTGAPRHAAKLPKDIKPNEVLPWRAACDLLQDVVNEINTTIRMRKHGRLTRLEALAADPTPRRHLDPAEYRAAFMTSGDMTYTWTKNGLAFDNNAYYGTGLKFGRRYLIRYLPTNRDFIEVYSLDNEWICRVTRADRMTRDQRAAFMGEREEIENKFKAIEAGTQAHRKQLAEAAHAQTLHGGEDVHYDGSTDRAAVLANRDATAVELAAREPSETKKNRPTAKAKKATGGTPKTAKTSTASQGVQRPRLPRVPADPPTGEVITGGSGARLANKYGKGLPGSNPAPGPTPASPLPSPAADKPQREDGQ